MHTKKCSFQRKPPSQHSCHSPPLFLTFFICHPQSNTISTTVDCIVNKMIFSQIEREIVCVCVFAQGDSKAL